MAEINLIFDQKRKSKIGVIQFDCSVSEIHVFDSFVTDHPVEEGSNITDHVRRNNKTLEFNGVITNTPIVNLEKENSKSPDVNDTTSPDDRVGLALSLIDDMIDNGTIVEVVTSLKTYSNMVIQSRSINRDVGLGNVLNVTLSLKEIILTQTKEVSAPEPVFVSKKQTTDQGKKTKTEANTNQQEKARSTLSKLADSLFSS